MLKSLIRGIESMMPKFAKVSPARQEMFDQSHQGQALAEVRPKHRVVDCNYVTAMSQGFKGTAAHWTMVKENYVDNMSKNVPITYVIDCNNILFDGQGMQDADGKWHR